MPEDQNAAGAAPDGNDAGQPDAGAPDANATPDQQPTPPAPPSANKLIKDFADSRGVTVSKLLEQFQQMEDQGKTELQRLESDRDGWKGKYDDLSGKYRTVVAQNAVLDAAKEARAISPRAVFASIRGDLDYDDDGNPTNVAALIEQLQKDDPDLFRAANGSADGGRGGQPATTISVNEAIRRAAGH